MPLARHCTSLCVRREQSNLDRFNLLFICLMRVRIACMSSRNIRRAGNAINFSSVCGSWQMWNAAAVNLWDFGLIFPAVISWLLTFICDSLKSQSVGALRLEYFLPNLTQNIEVKPSCLIKPNISVIIVWCGLFSHILCQTEVNFVLYLVSMTTTTPCHPRDRRQRRRGSCREAFHTQSFTRAMQAVSQHCFTIRSVPSVLQ